MYYNDRMPPDPFADDPNDPALFLESDDPDPPLTPAERIAMTHDLELIHEFRRVLEPNGIKGICFFCDDCEDNHYYDWDIMTAELQATLNGQVSAVHEPSAHPMVTAYVPWAYCAGYLDGMDSAQH
ncbi:DUF5319 domain-containing protein [Corynebacterium sp.]|uniref:DUF5319 domain-containing protein n=1 Tax=Corynebacterium sp. TaxID=1720 RepID=UPI0026DD184B|nr:DUF5319 domain-containing protein [Corynebacterium sp.]MDO5077093.1 DUF5319 domain-containing protein [Corynebacterium sp.]